MRPLRVHCIVTSAAIRRQRKDTQLASHAFKVTIIDEITQTMVAKLGREKDGRALELEPEVPLALGELELGEVQLKSSCELVSSPTH